MKYFYFLLSTLFLISSCNEISKTDYERVVSELKKSNDSITVLKKEIEKLSKPANTRFAIANRLVEEGAYDKALVELNELSKIFPESEETRKVPELKSKINSLQAKQAEEQARIKALGFKAIKTSSSVKIKDVTASFSGFSNSKTFIFDSYGDRWFYRTADKGSSYVASAMSVFSESSNPNLPQPALYRIVGGKMLLVGTFCIEFARWEDYGSYLGNYHDNKNDFSKVNTVKFKVGCEVPNDVLAKSYAIVIKKVCKMTRNYDRFANPPVSYTGMTDYPSSLSIEDFNGGNYVALKIANL